MTSSCQTRSGNRAAGSPPNGRSRSNIELLESSEHLANFRRAAGKQDGPFYGLYFNDTDVYKWLEAAAWSLAVDYDPELDALLDDVIQTVGEAQQPDGYLDNFYTIDQIDKRWTDLTVTHELYCAGHSSRRRWRTSGQPARTACSISPVALPISFATPLGRQNRARPRHRWARRNRAGPGRARSEQLAIGATSTRRSISSMPAVRPGWRGRVPPGPCAIPGGHHDVVGHAVRQVYYTAGAADIYAETGDESILDALHRLWDNMTQRRIYVSSGIGQRWEGESFGKDFELPNSRAYTESCAAIGSIMWNWRMLLNHRRREIRRSHRDHALQRHVAWHFTQRRPLLLSESARRWRPSPPRTVVRLCLLSAEPGKDPGSITGYLATTSDRGIWLHLYADSHLDTRLPSGQRIRLRQQTEYPWDGDVRIEVDSPGSFRCSCESPVGAPKG